MRAFVLFVLSWPITGKTSDVSCQPSDGGGGNDALSPKMGHHLAREDLLRPRLSPVASAPAGVRGIRVS